MEEDKFIQTLTFVIEKSQKDDPKKLAKLIWELFEANDLIDFTFINRSSSRKQCSWVIKRKSKL